MAKPKAPHIPYTRRPMHPDIHTWARLVHALSAGLGLSRSSSTGTRRIQSSQSSLVAHCEHASKRVHVDMIYTQRQSTGPLVRQMLRRKSVWDVEKNQENAQPRESDTRRKPGMYHEFSVLKKLWYGSGALTSQKKVCPSPILHTAKAKHDTQVGTATCEPTEHEAYASSLDLHRAL